MPRPVPGRAHGSAEVDVGSGRGETLERAGGSVRRGEGAQAPGPRPSERVQ